MKRLYQSDKPANTMQWCTNAFVTNWHCVGGRTCDGTMNGCDWCSACFDATSFSMCGSDPVEAQPYYITGLGGPGGGGGGSATTGTGNVGNPAASNDEIPIATNLTAAVAGIDKKNNPCIE